MHPPMNPNVIFAAGFLILFIGGGARFAIGLTLKPMVDELGWGRGELGLAVAAYMLVSAVATYLAGRWADRASPSLLLNAGVAMSGLGIGLMCLVGEPWHALLFYGVVFAVGNGMASLTPVGVMVTRAFPGRAGFANSAVISGMCLGQLVMIAALAAVLAQIGWRSVFVWLGLCASGADPVPASGRCRDACAHDGAAAAPRRARRAGGRAHAAVLAAARGLCHLRARRLLRRHARRGLRPGPRRRRACSPAICSPSWG